MKRLSPSSATSNGTFEEEPSLPTPPTHPPQTLFKVNTEPVQYHCDYCHKDISYSVFIHCATCADFDLCVECFSVGVELNGHKNNHDYRVIDFMHFPLFSDDWGADEEILLLEGFEKFGMDNWHEIAENVTTKSSVECQEHFNKYYRNSPQWPLIDLDNIKINREGVKALNSGRYTPSYYDNPQILEKTVTESTVSQPRDTKVKMQNPVRNDLNGYMPVRNEFETEYDDDAEKKINLVQFYEDDTDEIIDMKVQLVHVYNYRLQKREKIKQFVVSNRLHDIKYQDRLAKGRKGSEKELYKKLKKYLQVIDIEEFNTFIKGIAQEYYLLERIEKLQEYRRMGISTLKEGDEYKRKEKIREQKLKKTKKSSKKLKKSKTAPIFNRHNKGFELLCKDEKKLCKMVNMSAEQYLKIKNMIIFNKNELMTIVNQLNPETVNILYTFFRKKGWIHTLPKEEASDQKGERIFSGTNIYPIPVSPGSE